MHDEEMLRKDTLRERRHRLEEILREQRPHDGFTVRLGLTGAQDYVIVASVSSPMTQMTLDDFSDMGVEAAAPPPPTVYDFHITVHPNGLRDLGYPHIINDILAKLERKYPRPSE